MSRTADPAVRGGPEFDAVFTHATIGMAVVDLGGRFCRVNSALCRMLARTEAELLGRPFLDATGLDDPTSGVDDLRRLADGELVVAHHENRYLAPDGQQGWVRIRTAAVHDTSGAVVRFVTQMEDVTAQRQAERLLYTSEARFRGLFERSPVAIGLVDLGGRLRSVNDAFAELVGINAPRLVGRPLRQVIDGLSKADIRYALHPNTSVVGERHFTHADASPGLVLVVASRLAPSAGEDPEVVIQLIDLTAQRAGEDSLRHHGLHDALTGLPNRRLFAERLAKELNDPRQSGRCLAVVMVDLNHFNQVNNGIGHPSGDLVLIEVGQRLLAMSRASDTVSRSGGDEFALIARDVDDDTAAMALAAALRRRLSEPYHVAGNVIHVGSSVGVALASGNDHDVESLIQRADVTLHRAKQLSGGIAAFRAEDDSASFQRLGLVQDLRRAISNGEIQAVYQPIVDAGNTLTGVETLARWHHPARGAIPPEVFIPLAEQEALMDDLTRHMLALATTQHGDWVTGGVDVPSVSVNVSASSLREGTLWGLVDDTLRSSDMPPGCLTLEITENILADGYNPEVLTALERLHSLGVLLSIDDFGTGYSSMAYLKRLHFDELKIDRSFVLDLDTDERSIPIVRSLIELTHTLGLTVVAEGVETAKTKTVLRDLGCDRFQGYGICHPLPASAMAAYAVAQSAKSGGVVRGSPPGAARRRLIILVVDNGEAARQELCTSLERRGHEVHEAQSGKSTLMLQARHHPDVIVLDRLMPDGVNGVDTVPLLRRAGHTGPIVLFSQNLSETPQTVTLPLDVWPVSQFDSGILLEIIDAYAT